jgi:outer membrane protein
MRLKRLTLALALAALPLSGHSEDLLDAYRQARANDPTLAQSDAQRLDVGENVNQARALLLPQLSAGLSLSQTNGGNGTTIQDPNGPAGQTISTGRYGHTRTRDVSGQLSQTVFNLSQIADLKAAHSTADAQDATYQAALQDLYVRVATQYFAVLTDMDNLKFAKANEEAYKEQYDQANQRFKVGLSAITDVYQAKAQYDNARSETITAQNTLNDDRESLRQITGQPVGELKKLRDQLPLDPPSPSDENVWVENALKYNPAILAQQYSVEAAQHNIDAARAGHLPTLNANVNFDKGASWSENDGLHDRTKPTTTIGLTLTVPIFEGGATQSKVRQSIYQRDEAQDALEAQRRQVRRNTLNYYRTVLAGIAQVQSARSAVESAQKSLDATRAGYAVGTQTMIDVLNAIQTLTSSQSTYSQVRHQFVLNKLLLKQSTGTVDEKDLAAVNSLLQ